MIERIYYPALEFWAAQPAAERTKILEALKADAALAANDFAGLPPQVQAGVLAGLAPPAEGGPPTPRPPGEEDEETSTTKSRRGR